MFPLKRGLTEDDDRLMDKYERILLKSKEVYDDSTTQKANVANPRRKEKEEQ